MQTDGQSPLYPGKEFDSLNKEIYDFIVSCLTTYEPIAEVSSTSTPLHHHVCGVPLETAASVAGEAGAQLADGKKTPSNRKTESSSSSSTANPKRGRPRARAAVTMSAAADVTEEPENPLLPIADSSSDIASFLASLGDAASLLAREQLSSSSSAGGSLDTKFLLGSSGSEANDGEGVSPNSQETTHEANKPGESGGADTAGDAKLRDCTGALRRACFLGELDVAKKCLADGAETDLCDGVGRNCLHYAVAGGFVELVELLVNAGVKLNVRDHKNWTPLHIAVCKNFPAVTKVLLEAGTDASLSLSHNAAPCRCGKTQSYPIHFAAIQGNIAVSEILCQHGATVNDLDMSNRTPLHYAAYRNKYAYVQWLLDKGAALDTVDIHGRTPLHATCLSGELANAKTLIEKGCNVQLADVWDLRPVDIAASCGKNELVALLEATGSSLTDGKVATLTALDLTLAETICSSLQEAKRSQVERAIYRVGALKCLEIYSKTLQVERAGGMMCKDPRVPRRRTAGGVFFTLLQEAIQRQDWDYIRQESKEQHNARRLSAIHSAKLKLLQNASTATKGPSPSGQVALSEAFVRRCQIAYQKAMALPPLIPWYFASAVPPPLAYPASLPVLVSPSSTEMSARAQKPIKTGRHKKVTEVNPAGLIMTSDAAIWGQQYGAVAGFNAPYFYYQPPQPVLHQHNSTFVRRSSSSTAKAARPAVQKFRSKSSNRLKPPNGLTS